MFNIKKFKVLIAPDYLKLPDIIISPVDWLATFFGYAALFLEKSDQKRHNLSLL